MKNDIALHVNYTGQTRFPYDVCTSRGDVLWHESSEKQATAWAIKFEEALKLLDITFSVKGNPSKLKRLYDVKLSSFLEKP